MLSAFVSPGAARYLAKLRNEVSEFSLNSDKAVQVLKTEVNTIVIFEVFTVIVAPMLWTFLIDEACLRYYISFAPSLQDIMNSWTIGQQGISQLRPGFCARRLFSEFSFGKRSQAN